MPLVILIFIVIRPFISSLAFPDLNFVYSLSLLACLITYLFYKKIYFLDFKILLRPLILFYLVLFLFLFFSQDKLNSLQEIIKYIEGTLLFIIAASLSKDNQGKVIKIIIFTGVLISFLAIYQYFFGFKHLAQYLSGKLPADQFVLEYLATKRVFAPFITPGILGGYLAMLLPLFLIKRQQLWLSLPLLLALFFTLSLGAFLSLLGSLTIYFIFLGKLKKSQIFILLGLLIMVISIFIWRVTTAKEHLQPFFSISMRLSYWKESWEIIKAHPFVGWGLGNFSLSSSRYAHNSYLQIWAEMGALGLAALLMIVFIAFKECFKNLNHSSNKNFRVCLFTSCLVFLIHNLFDFTFFLPEVSFIWWVILGVLVGASRQKAVS